MQAKSRGYPNGETHPGKTWVLLVEHIDQWRERGELKHLSTRRKREYSLSSGERKGNSPNSTRVRDCGRCAAGVVGTNESDPQVVQERTTD